MSLTYSAFKTFVLASLWRPNDTTLSTNLDQIIKQANDELDKTTADWQRRQKTIILAPTTQDYAILGDVSDFQSIVSLNDLALYSGGDLKQTTLQAVYNARSQRPNLALYPYYAIDDVDGVPYIRFAATFSATAPGNLQLVYRKAIPDYSTAGSSWMEDQYFNLYLHTVMKHCALFNREDDRVQEMQALADKDFADADDYDKRILKFGATPLQMRSHRYVP